MDNTQKTASIILKHAQEYKKSQNRKMTYSDYERFKQELQRNFCFGYEAELSRILGV